MDNRYTSGCNGYGPYSILCALRLVVVSMFVSLLDPLTAILDGVMRFIGEMTPQGAFAVAASDAGQHLEVPCKRHSPLLGPLLTAASRGPPPPFTSTPYLQEVRPPRPTPPHPRPPRWHIPSPRAPCFS